MHQQVQNAHPALRFPVMELPPISIDDAVLANREENLATVEDLNKKTQEVIHQGGAKSQHLHLSRGQLLARDRLTLLLDQDSPFLELCTFAGYGQKDCTPSGSVVGGIGLVS